MISEAAEKINMEYLLRYSC